MRLVTAVLGWVLRKVGLFAVTVAAAFLAYLVVQAAVPALRDANAQRARLVEVTQRRAQLEADLQDLHREAAQGRHEALRSLDGRVAGEIDEGRAKVAAGRDRLEDLRDRESDACDGLRARLVNFVTHACDRARDAVRRADEGLDTVEGTLARAEKDAAVLHDPRLSDDEKADRLDAGTDGPTDREILATEAELSQTRAEEQSLHAAHDSVAGFVTDRWSASWRWLVGIALVAMLAPPLARVVAYFVLMPLVSRSLQPIRLADEVDDGRVLLHAGPAERTLAVRLDAGEVLSARSKHLRPVRGLVRSGLLYDWRAPFVSFAAGLYGLSRVTGAEEGDGATLATPDDPNSYLMRIDFEHHPGLVMRPRHVVGVIGEPQLRTRWWGSLQSVFTWQLRYIMFAGTGALIVQGCGDVVGEEPGTGPMKMDQELVMGFDSRLERDVVRTEAFVPYVWGSTPLVVDRFTGPHRFFWQKSDAEGPRNPITKVFDVVFSAIGKVLGF